MKANELRVGNYVDYFSENADQWLNNYPLSENHLMCLLNDRGDHADPIKLNEQWLKVFGFKRSDSIGKSSSFYYKPVGGSELHINPENGIVWIERENNIFNNPALIEYVHQLQNLYFALTGSELS